jgi:hypothetical protein
MTPILIYFSHINEFVKDALRDGWVPVIIAMLISRFDYSLFLISTQFFVAFIA